jgi:hypothetical protein
MMNAIVTVDPPMMGTPMTRHPHIIGVPFPIMPAVYVVRLVAHFDI